MSSFKKDFPIFKSNANLVYLDSAATALKPQIVIDKIVWYYEKYSANIHRGVYQLAYDATSAYEESRAKIAQFINAEINEVVFTSGTTAALNLVTLGLSKTLKAGDEVILSELEHHSGLLPWLEIAKEKSLVLRYVPLTDKHQITVNNFKKVLTTKTKVVALTHLSNVMGYLTDIKPIIDLAHEFGALVVLDAAQSISSIKIDVKDLGVDFLAFSGHKMFGPTGIGILFGKEKLLNDLSPTFYGGEMVNQVFRDHATYKTAPLRFEAGTSPIAGAIGLGAAVDYINQVGIDLINSHSKMLFNLAVRALKKLDDVIIYNEHSDAGILTFNIRNVHPHDAATIYDKYQIAIRAGHHCAQLVSSLLDVSATLRASFSIYNTSLDVEKFITATKEVIRFFGQF